MKCIFKYYLLFIFIVCVLFKTSAQTTTISGVINNYASVTSVGSQSVNVPSASGFMVGDKVLLIQMKGAIIDTTNTLNFGTISSYNDAGNYEMLVISAISSTTITFTNPISRTYNIVGLVQLVKVPVYNNVNVTGLLTCLPWNGLTGGVLVFEATGNVTLNANIDVTGKGFLGGAKVFGQFTSCAGNTTDFKLPGTSLVSANKGEGIMIIKPSFAKGMGALANGGGSGNDVNGGGAGGGNLGMGGRGGSNKCSTSPSAICGGYGGKSCVYSNMNNKIFLGGGGGAGHENDGVSTGGVSGGGIIIVRSGVISGNGNFIKADGSNNTIIAGNDGQGGGGAGGVVLIDACSTSSLNISVKGGYGGTDNFTGPDCHGKGGGGGGGIIWTSSSLTYTSFLNGGSPGVFANSASQCYNTSNGATVGQTGGTLTGLLIPGAVPLSSVGGFTLATSSNCISTNNSTATGTITTNVSSPLISYTWTNSSGAIISQTNNTTSLVNSVVNLANGVYILSVQMNAPCGPVSSQTLNINCVINPTVPCSGILTGTGMSICSQFSFSISTTQTITPFDYGTQNYSCNNATLPDVSFNIMGSGWRVEKHGWNFLATISGQITGYNSSGVLQTIPFLATNTITPLSYLGSFVQFAINGVASGALVDQTTFSISLTPDNFGANTYSYCVNTAPNIAISPTVPVTGGPWTYNWQPGALNGNPVNVSPVVNTIYTVTAISIAGCASTATVGVTINCCNLTLTLSPDTSICQGTSASVTLTANGASSYTWTPNVNATDSNATIVVVSPNVNTTYTVIGGAGTCTNTAVVTVNVIQNPPISVSDKTICAGTTETLIALGAATYSWSPSLGLNAITGQTVAASPLSTQMYVVNGTFTNGCIGNSAALVTVINNPTISVSASSLIICSGQSSSLTALGAPSFTWSPAISLTNANGSQTIATPLTTETYVVVGSSGVGPNFCTSTQTIQIQVLEKVIPSVSPSSSFCLGSSTLLYASGGTIYSWNPTVNVAKPNDSVTIVKPTISTIYTVTVSRNGLCPSISSATVQVVVNPLPIVNAGNDTVVNIGEYITLQGTGNVDVGFLSPSSVPLSCNFCPAITVNPYNTTCYTLMGANQYYCYNFDEVCVSVLKDWDVYIPNTFTPNDDLKNEYFIPLGYGIEKINIVIFDRWGLQLFKEENTTLGWDGKKNGKLCEQGIYVYEVEIFTLAGQVFNRTGHVNLLPRAN